MAPKKKHKGGRPPKPANEKLVRVTGCISPAILTPLMKLAEIEGLDQSGVVRAACEQYVSTRTLKLPKQLAVLAACAGTEK